MTQTEILISLFVGKQQTSVTWGMSVWKVKGEKKNGTHTFPSSSIVNFDEIIIYEYAAPPTAQYINIKRCTH